jgi:hypothetical protein
MRLICAAPQSPRWYARRDGTGHCARQEGRRYRLHRRATDSAPFSSLVTGRAALSSFAPRAAGLSGIARVAGFAFLLGNRAFE